MNENKLQNAKETACLLGSLSCGLLMLSPVIVILLCLLLCLLIFVFAVIAGGH